MKPWDRNRPVSFNVQILQTTAKALLVKDTDTSGEFWIPASQIVTGSEIDDGAIKGDMGELVLPMWLAEEKGMI